VAAGVVAQVDNHVIVVPDETKDLDIDSVALALDTDEYDESDALEDFFAMAKLLKAEVHCVHMLSDADATMDDEDNLENMQAYIGKKFSDVTIKYDVIKGENLSESLNAYAEQKNIEMIAMISQDKSFFERLFEPSYTRKMAMHTHVPLLILHKDED
jgi:nucleotide-binding universal stress UspA family protein